MDKLTILAVGAHPDDLEILCGGTLAKYASEGVTAHYLCATRGEAGSVEDQFLRPYASSPFAHQLPSTSSATRLVPRALRY